MNKKPSLQDKMDAAFLKWKAKNSRKRLETTLLEREILALTGSGESKKKKNKRDLPQCAALGWSKSPMAVRTLIMGVFCNIVCLFTPFWIYITEDPTITHTTFGLWHYCNDDACTMVHDNIIQGKDIPG